MNPVRNNLHSPCPWFIGMGFFTSNKEFDPNKEWPETQWQKVEGRFILAASEKHQLGETGGEEEHILTIDELAQHEHDFNRPNWYTSDANGSANIIGTDTGRTKVYTGRTEKSGGNKPHNNMPPYIVRVYWERIG